jgi:hypothetical protein
MDHTEKLNYLKRVHRFDRHIMTMVTVLSVLYFLFIILEFYLEKFSSLFLYLVLIDIFVCAIFLAESFYFLSKAKDRKKYFKRFFLDFLSAIPLSAFIWLWPQLIFLNIFKIIRGVKGIIKIYEFLREKMWSDVRDI